MADSANPLQRLAIFDPQLAARVADALAGRHANPSDIPLAALVEDILWASGQEIAFGAAVAEGYIALCDNTPVPMVERFGHEIRKAGRKGPTLGRIMALNLPPLLRTGGLALTDRFAATVNVMLHKGTYTLKGPLKVLGQLVDDVDLPSAEAYLELLKTAFAAKLSYNQSLHLTYCLPRAVSELPRQKRHWQIRCLRRVIAADVRLTDPFLDGLARGLQSLNRPGLERFVGEGLHGFDRDPEKSTKFFALSTHRGRNLFAALQVAVSFRQAAPQLNRYLRARLGEAVGLQPLSTLSDAHRAALSDGTLVVTDGRAIYLADEIDRYPAPSDNQLLFKCLVRFEAGLLEFNTFDFDLDIWYDRYNSVRPDEFTEDSARIANSDLQRFLLSFENAELAADLFTIFEHGRIRVLTARCYPGLIRQYLPMLQSAFMRQTQGGASSYPLERLYAAIALDLAGPEDGGPAHGSRQFVDRFQTLVGPDAGVEDSGELVWQAYHVLQSLGREEATLRLPFGRRICAALFDAAHRMEEQRIDRIREHLKDAGYFTYRSVIRRHVPRYGQLDADAVQSMIQESDQLSAAAGNGRTANRPGEFIRLDQLADQIDIAPDVSVMSAKDVTWYPEWDFRLADYLNDYTRVIDRTVSGQADGLYQSILEKHRGLVRQLRYSFELLRPQGLKIFRQWIEGDEFDYRALVDFAVDRKTGRTPSDRIYIKRLKAERSVSVLVLVDLSRSTANIIGHTGLSVLDVEKEAIVLLAEALEVIGDEFAIAGFSSSGRLGVDYYHIKDFEEPLSSGTRNRINAVAPIRNTRMGAAIRHAAAQFESVSSRVRLLIVLSDGFPNDKDYKKDYAVADTRRAVSELAAKRIHVHAITVNLKQDGISVLDDLYGDIHHSLISDVMELPDKLLQLYGALTR